MEIQFDTGNAAFADCGEYEAAQILEAIARRLRDGARAGVIYDTNGNRVGKWSINLEGHDE